MVQRKLLPLLILTLVLVYLVFVYAKFYQNIGDQDLKEPGMKSYQIKVSSNSGKITYVALGDSLTAGVGNTAAEKTLVYQSGQQLSLKYGQVNVVNLGVPGATADDLIKVQLPEVIKIQPEFISVLIGINDIHEKSSANTFGRKFKTILDELQSKTKAKIIVLTIPYLGSPKSVLPPFNWILDFQTKQFNKQIMAISQSHHVQLVDLYADTRLDFYWKPEYYASDLFHPSDQGYQLWGQVIKNAN